MTSALRIAAAAFFVASVAACSESTDPTEGPVVIEIAAASAPQPPAGNIVGCFTGPDGTTARTTCPVLSWNGIEYWAFSYEDQRNAMNIVGYNDDNDIVYQQEEEGARSLYQITVNSNEETVVFWGLGSATVTVSWSELEVQ